MLRRKIIIPLPPAVEFDLGHPSFEKLMRVRAAAAPVLGVAADRLTIHYIEEEQAVKTRAEVRAT